MTSNDIADPVDQPVTNLLAQRSARNSVGIVVRVLVGQVFAAAALLVLSIHLRPAEYALYAVVAGIAAGVFSLVTQPLVRVLLREPGALGRRTVDAAGTLAFGALVAASIVALTIAWWQQTHLGLVASACAYLVLRSLTFGPLVALQRNLHTAKASLLTLVDRVAFQAAVIAMTLAGFGIDETLVGGFLAAMVLVNVAAQHLHRWMWRPGHPREVVAKLGETVHASTIHVAGTVFVLALTPIVVWLAGPQQGGYFAWAYSINLVVMTFTSALDTAIMPAFARSSDAMFRRGYELSTRLLLLIALMGAAGVALVVPELVGPLFPRRWEDALPTLMLLALAGAVFTSAIPANSAWAARLGLAKAARWHVESFLVGAGVLVIATPPLGALGGALGFLAYTGVLSVRLHFATSRRLARGAVARTTSLWVAATVVVCLGGHWVVVSIDNALVSIPTSVAISLIVVPLCIAVIDRGQIVRDGRLMLGHLRGRATDESR